MSGEIFVDTNVPVQKKAVAWIGYLWEARGGRLSLRELPLDSVVLEGAWTVQHKHGLSWWDSLIVSAAQVSASRYLLSEDSEDGRDFDGSEVLNPFLRAPADADLR